MIGTGSLPTAIPEMRRDPAWRSTALATVIAALKRRYGEYIIRRGADGVTQLWPDLSSPVSTGSLGLDLFTGGLPRGRLTEYVGREGGGLETLAAAAVAACQRAGGLALLIDADGAADPDALLAVGVDLDRLILAAPTTMREGWSVLASLARCGALDLLVLASMPGLLALPRDDWPADRGIGVGDLTRRVRRVAWALRGRPTALLLLNRPRDGWGAAVPRAIAEEAITPVTALRVALTPDQIEHTPDGDIAALHAVASILKQHGAPRGPRLSLALTATGPCRATELVTLGQLAGCLAPTPLGLALNDVVLGRSPARAAATLRRDPDLAALLERRIREAWGGLASTALGGTR